MSNSYQTELHNLTETVKWAAEQNIDDIRSFTSSHLRRPLYYVGSGGSFSAAKVGSQLHEDVYGGFSKAITPYEVLTNPAIARETSIILVTASGDNTDIVASLSHLIKLEHRQIGVLCLNESSKIEELAGSWKGAKTFGVGGLERRDGFLATHSLIAFGILIARAYESYEVDDPSGDLSNLLGPSFAGGMGETSQNSVERLCSRDELIVLAGRTGIPAAIDIESKMSEAAIMPVQVLDYRNFAHGRHNWLAKRGPTTAVIGISGPRDTVLAKRTHDRIPESVPQKQIQLGSDQGEGIVAGLMFGFHIVGAAATARGIDPANPGIPSFGRRIYNLKTIKYVARQPGVEDAAVRRKLHAVGDQSISEVERTVRESYGRFIERIDQAAIEGVVFDYDGTLCRPERRFEGLERSVAVRLERLLDAGVEVGVVSGRGGSMGEELRGVVGDCYWKSLLVGYYNGAVIQDVGVEEDPADASKKRRPQLEEMFSAIKSCDLVGPLIESCRRRTSQITLFPSNNLALLYNVIEELRADKGLELKLVMSTHSVDVIPEDVGKGRFVREFCRRKGIAGERVLRIGDRGDRRGNDFELLADYPSLSVDRVSRNLDTCWNLGPVGGSGVDTTISYVENIKREQGRVHFCTSSLES